MAKRKSENEILLEYVIKATSDQLQALKEMVNAAMRAKAPAATHKPRTQKPKSVEAGSKDQTSSATN